MPWTRSFDSPNPMKATNKTSTIRTFMISTRNSSKLLEFLEFATALNTEIFGIAWSELWVLDVGFYWFVGWLWWLIDWLVHASKCIILIDCKVSEPLLRAIFVHTKSVHKFPISQTLEKSVLEKYKKKNVNTKIEFRKAS